MGKAFHAGMFALLLMFAMAVEALAANGRFVGDVVAKWLPNGRDMELTQPFSFVDANSRQWSVPKGTVVDGASIPRPLWTVVGAPFTGKYRKASVIHDYHCQTMSKPWQEVHRAFYEAALLEGNSAYHSKLMYSAVYTWGPRWEIVGGKPTRARGIVRQPTDAELSSLANWLRESDPPLAEIDAYAQKQFPRKAM